MSVKQGSAPAVPSITNKIEPGQPSRKSEPPAMTAKNEEPIASTQSTPSPPARNVAAEPTRPRTDPAAKPPIRSGWVIQVGAYPAEEDAKQRLTDVKSKAAKILAGTDPFTETVDKAGTTYYRARFAGFDKEKAEAACKYLKRNDVDCVIVKN
jgi:D-alanyl-D-alanine carboxypeptidase